MHLHDTERLVRFAVDGDHHAACELIRNLKHHGDLEGARRVAYLMILRGDPHDWEAYGIPGLPKDQLHSIHRSADGYLSGTYGKKCAVTVCGSHVPFDNIATKSKGTSKPEIRNRKIISVYGLEIMFVYAPYEAHVFKAALRTVISGENVDIPAAIKGTVNDRIIANIIGKDKKIVTSVTKYMTDIIQQVAGESGSSATVSKRALLRWRAEKVHWLRDMNFGARLLIGSGHSHQWTFKDIINNSHSGTEAQASILGAIQKEVNNQNIIPFFDFEAPNAQNRKSIVSMSDKDE